MVALRQSARDELPFFDEIDRQDHARNFITQIGLKAHYDLYDDPDITYLSIENDAGQVVGYFVLVLEPESQSLEFRRISIDQSSRGVGQTAINEMERFCGNNFSVQRIWLDVYQDNVIGRHVYEKLGYKQFNEELREGRKLLFYEKTL